MDWGRAKNILLVVLVATNIFLISVYGIRYEKSKENNSELYSYTVSQMEKNNINLACEIPEHPSKLPSLTVQYGKYDSDIVNKAIKSASDTDVRAQNDEDFVRIADDLVEECGLKTAGTAISQTVHEQDGAVVVEYENRYGSISLQECYMKVIFQDGKVSRLERRWVEPVEEGETKLEITEPATALLSFIDVIKNERAEANGQIVGAGSNIPMEKILPADTDNVPVKAASEDENNEEDEDTKTVTVQKLDLVYYVENSEIGRDILYDTAFPAWRIEYNDGKIKYISAFEQ